MKYYITGDCHGDFSRFIRFKQILGNDASNIGIIILGDAGLNFWLNDRDIKNKTFVNNLGFTFYCVRGNHESRPEDMPSIRFTIDKEVKGIICYEEAFPNIKYLLDGEEYYFNDYRTLVIGGAYSVDKWQRILRNGRTEETNNPKVTGWWANEQLSEPERESIENRIYDREPDYDFVFTHTCPRSWEPTDLFIRGLDQNKIDKTTENWLDEIAQNLNFHTWCFGHFHSDRQEGVGIEQFYQDIADLDDVYNNKRSTLLHMKRIDLLRCPKCGYHLCQMTDNIYTCAHCDTDWRKENDQLQRYYFG